MTQREALTSLVRKSGYSGAISDNFLSRLSVTRYRSNQARLDYDTYLRRYGRYASPQDCGSETWQPKAQFRCNSSRTLRQEHYALAAPTARDGDSDDEISRYRKRQQQRKGRGKVAGSGTAQFHAIGMVGSILRYPVARRRGLPQWKAVYFNETYNCIGRREKFYMYIRLLRLSEYVYMATRTFT